MTTQTSEAFDFRREDDMEDARREAGRLEAQAEANDTDTQHVAMMNPLGLVASDLMAVGWDSDATGQTWFRKDHGACTFLEATHKEANL